MKINKVVILGIDALEYDLVEKWNFKNLKQEEYGKTELPTYFEEEPNTRIIWPCFITGKMPHEMGYVTGRVFKPPLQFFVNIVFPNIKFIFNPQKNRPSDVLAREKNRKVQFSKSIYIMLNRLNLVKRPTRSDIKASTLFDNIPKSIHLHVPIYDEYLPPYSNRTIEAIENKAYRPIFEMQCLQEFKERTKEVFECLTRQNEWNLCMQYFWLLDGIQHVFYNNPKKIAKFYIMFDEFVGKVRQKIDDNTLLLIVSDHGQKKGIHTNYGFYSVNKLLGLKNPRLIDFRWMIEELLKKNI